MKAVISKIDLVAIIGKIQTIVPLKPTNPILGTVLLEAVDDQLIVSATDLVVSIRCHAEAKVIEEGAIALPARRFFQLIRELTSPQIKITANTNEVAEITTGTSLFKINGMNKKEFPHFPDLNNPSELSLSHSALKQMLSKTSFCTAREDSRYMLNGVQLQIANQKVTFIGTDGKRLAKVGTSIEIDQTMQASCIIPLKAVEEMIKILDESLTLVHLALDTDKISLEAGSITLTSKLLSGQYPDVERVIPLQLTHQFFVHREELMTLLRQVSLFTSDTSNSVRFAFEPGQLHLAALSSELGEGKVSMPVDYSGPNLEIAFNPFFFIDILRHIKDETFQFGINNAHNPGLITDSTQAVFVLMPMRLADPAVKTVETTPHQEVEI